MSDQAESDIIHRELETDQDNPAIEIAEVVAGLEEKDEEELTPTYRCVDHVIDHVFSDPPAAEAQVEVTFSYEGYRITIEQDGKARFIKTE